MDTLARELRQAVRGLTATPGFFAVSALTLALGIGAATAIFSVVYGLLLRPLPYVDADRLVLIEAYRTFAERPPTRWNYSYLDLEDWRTRSTAYESIDFFAVATFAVSGGDGVTEDVDGAAVTSTFFETVRPPMLLGRGLTPDDATRPVAVIGEQLWSRRYGRAADIVGRTITLDDAPFTIVGVAGAGLQLPDEDREIWISAEYRNTLGGPLVRGRGGMNPIGRLRAGVTLPQAQSDADNVARALAAAYPEVHSGASATVTVLREDLVGEVRPALLVLLAAVGLLLTIACANIANLLVARGAARGREIAIRAALGATRGQVIRHSLLDASVLSVTGSAAGVALAYALVRLLLWLEPPQIESLDGIAVDLPVLAFAAGVTALVTLTVGLIPALQHTFGVDHLKSGPPAMTPGRRARRLGRVLAVAQLAAAVVLLVGTALLGRSLVQLLSIDIGVPSDRVAALIVTVRTDEALDTEQRYLAVQPLLDRVVERVGAVPGIEAAALTFSLPPNFTRSRGNFELRDPATGVPAQFLIDVVPVGAGFFDVIRLPLVRGRLFEPADHATRSSTALIISEGAAQRFFPGQDPIGRTMPVGQSTGDSPARPDMTVVGVVRDVRYVGLQAEPLNTFYMPYETASFANPFVIARTTGNPEDVLTGIQAAAASVDPRISIGLADTLEGLVGRSTAEPRFRTLLLAIIAALALVIAAVGVYGVIAYAVAQRTSEIGVRMAIGATPADIARLVLREGTTVAIAGIGIGLAAAYGVTDLLEQLLYEVTPTDTASFVIAGTVLLVVAIMACYVPARRATKVDPLVALRCE